MEESKQEGVLAICMLGGLSISYQDQPLQLSKSISGKMIQLFLMLLFERKQGIHRDDLLRALYDSSDLVQASNSLRTMIFRLRKSLISAGLPEDEYIAVRGGRYYWESEKTELYLDVEAFAETVETARKEPDISMRIRLLRMAERLYKGEFLPSMIGESWVAVFNHKCQENYFMCIRALLADLKEQKQYDQVLIYCNKTVQMYPYEEWQIEKLDCLIIMKEYISALKYYEEVAEFYQEEFGLPPSEELLNRRRIIKEQVNCEIRGIQEIQDRIMEGEEELGEATYCDYFAFTEIYRYMTKLLGRIGMSAYLVLYTITDKDRMPIDKKEVLEDVREALHEAIGLSIRKSDVYARYGKNQFLVLLIGTNRNGCEVVARRVKSQFQTLNVRKKVDICYTVESILNVKPDMIKKKFDQNGLDWR